MLRRALFIGLLTGFIAVPTPLASDPRSQMEHLIQEEYAKLRLLLPDAPPLTLSGHMLTCGWACYVPEQPQIFMNGIYFSLTTQLDREDIRFILAHEMGHWLHHQFAQEDFYVAKFETDLLILKEDWPTLLQREDPIQKFADDFALTLMPEGFDKWRTLEKLGSPRPTTTSSGVGASDH